MSVLLFLLAPLVVIVVGSMALSLRHRKPQGMRSSIGEFEQQMKALSPDGEDERGG